MSNIWIGRNEIEEMKNILSVWHKDLNKTQKKQVGNITEEQFYTVAKRVCNLELQNRERAKLLLSNFSTGDILNYLMTCDEVKAVIYVDKKHTYDIKTNFTQMHGSGEDRVIIVH